MQAAFTCFLPRRDAGSSNDFGPCEVTSLVRKTECRHTGSDGFGASGLGGGRSLVIALRFT